SAPCSAPSPVVARGRLSFTNITPCPTNTSSPMTTPSQMKVWLWILQRAPITTPRWISTNGPTRVASPSSQPYRLVNDCTTTPRPQRTSARRRKGASLTGPSATEVRRHGVHDGLLLRLGDAGVERQRDRLARE